MGEGVQIRENPKSVAKKEEDFFCNLMEALVGLDQRSLQMLEVGVDLTLYEDPFHQIIEGMIYRHYGEVKAQIIMWWLLAVQENDGVKNLTLKVDDDKEHNINTPKQLYKVLKKVKI